MRQVPSIVSFVFGQNLTLSLESILVLLEIFLLNILDFTLNYWPIQRKLFYVYNIQYILVFHTKRSLHGITLFSKTQYSISRNCFRIPQLPCSSQVQLSIAACLGYKLRRCSSGLKVWIQCMNQSFKDVNPNRKMICSPKHPESYLGLKNPNG